MTEVKASFAWFFFLKMISEWNSQLTEVKWWTT